MIELQKNTCKKYRTSFSVKMMRPLDSIIAAVLNEKTNVLVDQGKLIKFTFSGGQYMVDCKKSKSPETDLIVFKLHLESNAPAAMIHRSEYSLSKLPFNRECSDLNDRVAWFLNEHLADVSFRCINRKTKCIVKYPGHRMILSSLSSSMRSLLQQSLSGGLTDIDWTCHSSESVHSLLRLLYTGQIVIDAGHLSETLDVLHKYCNNSSVWTKVVEKLSNLVTSSTVLAIYEFACDKADETANLIQLRDYCLAFIDANADVTLADETFTGINKSTLCNILQRDTLVTRESRLFSALNEWSKKQCTINSVEVSPCNQLKFIGDSIKFIRFNAMTAKEFACGPALSGLITNNDTIRFLMQVANSQAELTANISMFGKPRNQQSGWTNGLLDITSPLERQEEQVEEEIASAPSLNQLNELAASCDDNVQTKLHLMYPNLKN